MTVASTTNRITYTCDGATVDFPYTFRIFEDSDLVVTLREIATGTETVLTLTTHYTVSGAGDMAGGNVTTVATYSNAYTLTIRRVLDLLQALDYIVGGAFPAEDHEQGLDRLTMICQQLNETLGRAIKFTAASGYSDIDLPDPEADKMLGWNAGATGLENKTVTTVIGSGTIANKTAAYTVVADTEFVYCTGTFTVTLPAASNGYMTWVCNKGTGIITVQAAVGDTIEGMAQIFLPDQYKVQAFKGDGVLTVVRL